MKIRDLLQSAVQSLTRNKGRTALTMLGIVIGILSVIVVLSIGEAAQRSILGQINSLGTDIIFLQSGNKELANSPEQAFATPSLTYADGKKLDEQPWIKYVLPLIITTDLATGRGEDITVQVTGTFPDEALLYDLAFDEGGFFDMSQVESRNKSVVLGYEVAKTIFGDDTAVGNSVKINNQNFRVIGVVTESGSRAFTDLDKSVYMPVTAAMDLYGQRFMTYVIIQPDGISQNETVARVTDIMRDQHRLREGDDDDFFMETMDESVESVSQITDILSIFLSSVAAISLLVGGIGIMNIMYVSVTERTREIGLRKALGAKNRDVLGQFLAEAICLTVIGGIIGVLCGIGVTWLAIQAIASVQDGWTFSVSTSGVMLGFFVSAGVGILFGYAPAKQASKLRPIEALRRD
jgi:putative ABC transport system permease protein